MWSQGGGFFLNKYLIFFTFFFYPASLDFLFIGSSSYALHMFSLFMLFRAVLLDVPIVVTALTYWLMLRLRYFAFFNLPHSSAEQVLLPYICGLVVDRFAMLCYSKFWLNSVSVPHPLDVAIILGGAGLLSLKIRVKRNESV